MISPYHRLYVGRLFGFSDAVTQSMSSPMSAPALPPATPGYVRRVPVSKSVPRENPLMVILPAVLLLYAAIMPPEIRVTIADQTLYPPRIVGLLMLPWLLMRISRSPPGFRIWDYLFFAGTLWMTFAFMVYYGPGSGFVRGAALTFDAAVPYVIGRLCIRNLDDFRRFLVFAAPGLILVGGSMFLEVLAGRPLIRPAMANVFGALPAYQDGVAVGERGIIIDQRLGILRAGGPFSHPIHAGMFLASFFPLYIFAGIRSWPGLSGKILSFFAVFSASSGAYLGLLMGIGLVMVDYFQRMITFLSWRLIVPAMAGLLTVAHFGTERGIINYLLQFTLNPSTARYRRIIWDYGTQSVERNPWFGIGFTGYERLPWMVSSIDNHWLMLAIRFGVIPSFAVLGAAIAILFLLGRSASMSNEADRKLRVGITISLFTMIVLGFSVAFFGGMQTWFYQFMGMCMAVGTSVLVRRGPVNPSKQRAPQREANGNARPHQRPAPRRVPNG